MTQSLPGTGVIGRTAAGRQGSRRQRRSPASTLRALPRIPNAVKRLLLGGRSITIDGNTLDTTLQLMLAAQTAVGLNGLIASDDVGASRTQLRILAASFKQDIPVAAVTNLSIPGPGGSDPARHYRPVDGQGAAAAGLLPRRRSGHRRPRNP